MQELRTGRDPTLPGPQLNLIAVDNELRIFLSNALPAPVPVVISGQGWTSMCTLTTSIRIGARTRSANNQNR